MSTADGSEHTHGKHTVFKTWLIILLIVAFIVFKDGLSYVVVGDLGQPDWDYRPVQDVPGESKFAMYPSMPYPQHIRGKRGK